MSVSFAGVLICSLCLHFACVAMMKNKILQVRFQLAQNKQ